VEAQTAPFVAKVSITAAVKGESAVTALPFHFIGEEAATKKEAEQSAAAVACKQLQFLPPLATCAAAPNPFSGGAKLAATSNFKGRLIELLNHILLRPVAPREVVYSTNNDVGPFVVTVSITAAVHSDRAMHANRSPLQFIGLAARDKKSAEQNAAAVAFEELQSFQPLEIAPAIEAIPKEPLSTSPEKSSASALTEGSEQQGNFKSQLNNALMQYLGRPVAAGEVIYTVTSAAPSFVVVVDLTRALKQMTTPTPATFQGSGCPRKKDAEQSAAEHALNELKSVLQVCSSCTTETKQPVDIPHTSKSTRQFSCKLEVRWGHILHVNVATPSTFRSKHAAKQAAAFLACIELCKELQSMSCVTHLDRKASKQTSTQTRKLRAALAPSWHGELLEKCPAAGLQCARLRVEKGWTQRQLAQCLQPPQRLDVIKHLEADGEMPEGKIIDAINCALGTTLPRSKPRQQKLELGSTFVGSATPAPAQLEEFIVMSKADMETRFQRCGS
jgi:ribosome-binding protein aMBF1 (putative translation factor)